MQKYEIRSKAQPGLLLHVVLRGTDVEPKWREDVSPHEEPLQVSAIGAEPNTVYKPHMHIPKMCPSSHVTQEAWVVISGEVEVVYYDIDGVLLERQVLKAGDCSVTYRGGHGYNVGTAGVRVYEFKTGPYHGQKLDKVWLEPSQ